MTFLISGAEYVRSSMKRTGSRIGSIRAAPAHLPRGALCAGAARRTKFFPPRLGAEGRKRIAPYTGKIHPGWEETVWWDDFCPPAPHERAVGPACEPAVARACRS